MVHRYIYRSQFALLALFTFLVFGGDVVRAADVSKGQRIFQKCATCHSLVTDSNGFGPTLKNVVGRPAGTVAGYRYSAGMMVARDAGLVWDEASLSEFLRSPSSKVPGTSMRFWGFWFQSEIDDVLAYIKANQ